MPPPENGIYNFREYGHDLFLTMPEALVMIADAPPPVRRLDEALPAQNIERLLEQIRSGGAQGGSSVDCAAAVRMRSAWA